MPSPVDIANLALNAIRARSNVTSINPSDGSVSANVISQEYQTRMDGLMRAAPWNFTRFQAPLTLLKAAPGTPENVNGTTLPFPPAPWAYEYAWPSNPYCLRARFILPFSQPQIPTGSSGSFSGDFSGDFNSANNVPLTTGGGITTQFAGRFDTQIPFITASDLDANGNQIRVILTNKNSANLVYTARITDPNLWDSAFVECAIATLAAWICEPLSGNNALSAKSIQLAGALINAARLSDANEDSSSSDHTPDWISARYRQSTGALTSGSNSSQWDSMAFPNGVVY